MTDYTIPQDIPTKQCTKCNRFLPATTEYFYRQSAKKDGFHPQCKSCMKGKYYQDRPLSAAIIAEKIAKKAEGLKMCSSCHKWLPISEDYFHRHNASLDGFRGVCITCRGFTKRIPLAASEGHKRCSKCMEEKPSSPEYFYRATDKKDGLSNVCKACDDSRKSQWDSSNVERRKKSQASYSKTNRESIRQKSKQWREENKEKLRQKSRQYRTKNEERLREKRRNTTEQRKEWMRAWREKNVEREQESGRKYRKENLERLRIANHHYIARKASLPADFTESDWRFALDYFGGCCAYCGRPAGLFHTLAMDHFLPLKGDTCPGTIPTNIVPACHSNGGCNNSKHDKDPVEWATIKFGDKKAKAILARIQDFFSKVRQV